MESFISCQGLKLVFACDSFRSSSRDLGVIEVSTCMINKKSTTCICDCHYHGSLVSNQEQWRYSGQQKYNPLVWCGQLLEFFLTAFQPFNKFVTDLLWWWLETSRANTRFADGSFGSNAGCTFQAGYVAYRPTWFFARDEWACMKWLTWAVGFKSLAIAHE